MVYEEPKQWVDFLPLVFWAYHTSKHTLTQATFFSLVYGVEAMVLIKVIVLSARLVLTSKVSDPNDRVYDVEALEEKRQNVEGKCYLTKDRLVDLLIKW